MYVWVFFTLLRLLVTVERHNFRFGKITDNWEGKDLIIAFLAHIDTLCQLNKYFHSLYSNYKISLKKGKN